MTGEGGVWKETANTWCGGLSSRSGVPKTDLATVKHQFVNMQGVRERLGSWASQTPAQIVKTTAVVFCTDFMIS